MQAGRMIEWDDDGIPRVTNERGELVEWEG
jgi:hypothetical protein